MRTVSVRHAAAFETKAALHDVQTTSAKPGRNESCADHAAALADALEAAFPDADIYTLQQTAEGLVQRMNGPELDFSNLNDDEEDMVAIMPPAAWDALGNLALARDGVGIRSAFLSPELSSGGQLLMQGLSRLRIEHLHVSVPAEGGIIDMRDVQATGDQHEPPMHFHLHIRPGYPDSNLEHIFVPEGAKVDGHWQEATSVHLHFTDAHGAVRRSTRLFQGRGGQWEQLPAVDLDCIERSNKVRAAFISAVETAHPGANPHAVDGLYDALLSRIKGPVFDLSDCVGREAEAVRALPSGVCELFRTDPLAQGLTTVIVSHEVSVGMPILAGLHQQLNPNDPRTAFCAAAKVVLADFPVGDLFDTLINCIQDAVLNLRRFSGPMAEALRRLPQQAWNDFLRHPSAANLSSMVVNEEVFAAGPLASGLSMQLDSSDRRESPDARTAFIALVEHLPLNRQPNRLFDELVRRTRGKTLDLRGFHGEDAQALRTLPPEAWKAFMRHRRAGMLTSAKLSPELFVGGPLVPGLKLRLDLTDPRAAFVAAAEPALPGRPVYKLFDMLVSRIEGEALDLSDVRTAVSDLRSLPQSAWKAFLKHPKAADLKTIIASDALFAGGPLVHTLQNALRHVNAALGR